MIDTRLSRREWLTAAGAAPFAAAALGAQGAPRQPASPAAAAAERSRAQRLQWWRDAKFGMFIHWGLYSVLGRHEWVMENEGIPIGEYERLADRFVPKPNAARAWAALAKRAGMKYMVMTTKHHEGFCHFDSTLTDYCAPKRAANRDLVREYVDAARAEGLRVGFYYSLMDWHHPDGARCETDEAARRRFVDYIHGQIRELLTNYGKVDILWYDVAWPLDVKGWESERMNDMVFQLQPDILVNNRNRLEGDFSTPEQRIQAEQGGRAWEACMTMNGSWGYHAADDAWKTPKDIVNNLITCARDGGNYLLNIGPAADGSIPQPSVEILSRVGEWMRTHGETIYGAERCPATRSNYANFTRKGRTLFVHVRYWPGEIVTLGGLRNKVVAASLVGSGTPAKPIKFDQDDYRVRFVGLPERAPDSLITTIAVECDGEPKQDNVFVRRQKPRQP
jgi:alpha-L-fucosidase